MALKDLKSDLTWHGKTPPNADNFLNTDAEGFVIKKSHGDPSDFKGISGEPGAMKYTHTGIKAAGVSDPPKKIFADKGGKAISDRTPKKTGLKDLQSDKIPSKKSEQPFKDKAGKAVSPLKPKQTGLMTLTSDLSWYGKTAPGPYKPNKDAQDTKFSNRGDGIAPPGVTVTGYSTSGKDIVKFRAVNAANSFNINPLDSTKGLASRGNQGGAGFPFLGDTGFSNTARYADAVKRSDLNNDGDPKLTSGLTWRYTANSPIDDQYNKFKVRDEAWNPIGYAKEPYILRGLQENGRAKPRRWGFGLNFDDGLIRSGIVTAAERLAVDTVRLGKWLIKPKGILWMVKQFGMQQTNPTLESPMTGMPGNPLGQDHKLFTPINLLANNAGNALGLHFQRHGILPVPTSGRYEQIHKDRNALGSLMAKGANRLNIIGREMFATPASQTGLPVLTRTAANGPNTLYGIPGTSTLAFPIRYENTRKGFDDATNIANKLATQSNQYFSTATPGISTNLSPTYTKDLLGRSFRGTLKFLDEEVSTHTKSGGENLRKRWKTVTQLGVNYNKFVLTGLNAQLTHQEGVIKGYGAYSKITGRINTQSDPYFGDKNVPGTSIRQSQAGSTPDEKEDNLRSGKLAGKKLKDQANYYAKGQDGFDFALGANSSVQNVPQAVNTDSSTAAGNNIKTVQHYASLTYGQIEKAAEKRATGEQSNIDFREDLPGKAKNFSSKNGNWSSENQHIMYNVPDSGKSGRDRSDRFSNNVPDPIQSSEWNVGGGNADPGLKDFIEFKFYPIKVNESLSAATDCIQFRAYIDTISDNITPNWLENNDQGRADAKIMLESWSREISISFKVAAFSGAELQALYNKMEGLALCAYPDYSADHGFVGRYVKIHIGDLYKNEPCYITNIAFDWDNESPWELDDGLQVPYYTSVNLNLGWIGNMRPDANKTKVFSVKSPSAGGEFGTADGPLVKPPVFS